MPKKREIPKGHVYVEDKTIKENHPQRTMEMINNENIQYTKVENMEAEPLDKGKLPKTSKQRNEMTKLLVDISTRDLDDFRIMCDLFGKTQKELVSRALHKYIMERRELIRPFLELRRKGLKEFSTETAVMKELEKKQDTDEY